MPEIQDVISGGSVKIQLGCGKEFWAGVICRCPGRIFRHSGFNLLLPYMSHILQNALYGVVVLNPHCSGEKRKDFEPQERWAG